MALTPKQKLFADEYLIDLNATRAYKAAYQNVKSDEVAAAAGARLLRNVNVANHISEQMKERERRTEITQDLVLAELWKIASTNGADFSQVIDEPVIRDNQYVVDPDTGKVRTSQKVKILPTDSIPNEKRAAISGLRQTKYGIDVETYDKVKALELIGKHLGMWGDKKGQPESGADGDGVNIINDV